VRPTNGFHTFCRPFTFHIVIAIVLAMIASAHVHGKGAEKPQNLDKYGGWTGLKGERTGFFHTQKINDRWWLVTPEGNAFFSVGVYCVRISGRVDAKTGRRNYKENSLFLHGNENEWARIATERVHKWGFNTIGDWSSGSVIRKRQFPYVLGTSLKTLGTNVIRNGWGRFPDVFDDNFAVASREKAKKLVHGFSKGQLLDQWLLGYFIDDEASFYGSDNAWGSLVEDYARLPGSQPGKMAWTQFIREKYVTIEKLNAAWKSDYDSFEELKNSTAIKGWIKSEDKSAFLELISERFVSPICNEIRRLDPNHLILGPRPTRYYPEIMRAIGPYCDIVNVSAYQLNRGETVDPSFDDVVNGIAVNSKKPVMLGIITRASSGGYPNADVRTQRDRGLSYQRYLRKVCSNSNVVGLHWFAYFDPPIANADTGNWGLVTEGDEPYTECVELVTEINSRLYEILSLDDGQLAQAPSTFSKAESPPRPTPVAMPIADSGFEKPSAKPWLFQKWRGNGKASVTNATSHSGKHCLELRGSGAGHSSTVVAVQYNPSIKLKPDHRYRLSVSIKSEGLETLCGARLKTKRTNGTNGYIEATIKKNEPKWTKTEIEFDNAIEKIESIEYLAIILVGNGTAWADDVAIEDLGSFAEAEPPVPEDWPTESTISNPGVEKLDINGKPIGWQLATWQGTGTASVDTQTVRSGTRAIVLSSGRENGWGSIVAGVQMHPSIRLEAGRRYVYSTWVLTKGIEAALHTRIKVKYVDEKDDYIQCVVGADLPTWTEVRKEFTLRRDAKVEYIGAVLVGQGQAWIDDLTLSEKP